MDPKIDLKLQSVLFALKARTGSRAPLVLINLRTCLGPYQEVRTSVKTSWVTGHRGFSPKVEFKRVILLPEFMNRKNGHGSVSLKWLVILSEFVTEKGLAGWFFA